MSNAIGRIFHATSFFSSLLCLPILKTRLLRTQRRTVMANLPRSETFAASLGSRKAPCSDSSPFKHEGYDMLPEEEPKHASGILEDPRRRNRTSSLGDSLHHIARVCLKQNTNRVWTLLIREHGLVSLEKLFMKSCHNLLPVLIGSEKPALYCGWQEEWAVRNDANSYEARDCTASSGQFSLRHAWVGT